MFWKKSIDKGKEELINYITGSVKNANDVVIPDKYKKDEDVAMALAKTNGGQLFKMDSTIFNKKIILEALKSNISAIKYVPDELYDDKEIVLMVVNSDGHLLWKVSDRLLDDIDVVKTAIRQNPEAIRFAGQRLKDSNEIKSILNLLNEDKNREEEKHQEEIKNRIEQFKNKPIWWQKEDIVNNEKLENSITEELVQMVEDKLHHKLPKSYIDLLATQNGGRLIKKYYVVNGEIFEIDCIYGISEHKGIIEKNYYLSDYVDLDNVMVFGDNSHIHYLFDYSDASNDEPKIIYYDDEVGRKLILANDFKQFIDNLKIKEEINL